MITSTDLTSVGMPWRLVGIGSVLAEIWAVVGSMNSGARTTIVPRSKGPATAGVIVARLTGAPL